PTTMLTKVIGRSLYAKGRADVPALVSTMVAATVMGYLAMSAKDAFKGRNPRDPKEAKTWVAAFIQGGGAGILGDFILGDYNRFGGGLISTIAGPSAASVEDLAKIYAAVRDGNDASAKTLGTIINNTPFVNLFYTRAAMDHLFLYQLQEAMNKGYLRRMERRIQKENNQTFFIKPTSAVN
ncbi:MAG: hypothetical protein MK137_04000, partial [Rickettsiales bacterium]|nr:hypothetical protein [Rickettsiales bacterium]